MNAAVPVTVFAPDIISEIRKFADVALSIYVTATVHARTATLSGSDQDGVKAISCFSFDLHVDVSGEDLALWLYVDRATCL